MSLNTKRNEKVSSIALHTYVALLRAINVGGKNIIKMDALRDEFEKMGFLSIKTYIQSGNVIFQSDMTNKTKIEQKIEKALAARFSYDAKVLIRSKLEMKNTIAHFPQIFENSDWKHNVIFLCSTIDSKATLQRFETKKDIEQIFYHDGVLYWSAQLDQIAKSTMLKLSTRPEYKETTIRNINTTKKIFELMIND